MSTSETTSTITAGRQLTPGPPLETNKSTPQRKENTNTLLQDLYATELLYVEELSLLQTHYDPNTDIYNAIERIKLLHDETPYTLDGIESWFVKASSHYARYISLFRYSSDNSPQAVYLAKRPLVRLRTLSKALSVDQMKNKSTAVLLKSLATQAKMKLESVQAAVENADKAKNPKFVFNKVKNFETLEPVSSTFDPSSIIYQGQFDLVLDHPKGKWPKLAIEAFILGTDADEKSLALCSLDYPRLSLLFPVFRSGDLYLINNSATKNVLVLRCCNCRENKTITLERVHSENDEQAIEEIQIWKQKLEKLFTVSDEDPTLEKENPSTKSHTSKSSKTTEIATTTTTTTNRQPLTEKDLNKGLGISFETTDDSIGSFASELFDGLSADSPDTTLAFTKRPPSMLLRPPRPIESPVSELEDSDGEDLSESENQQTIEEEQPQAKSPEKTSGHQLRQSRTDNNSGSGPYFYNHHNKTFHKIPSNPPTIPVPQLKLSKEPAVPPKPLHAPPAVPPPSPPASIKHTRTASSEFETIPLANGGEKCEESIYPSAGDNATEAQNADVSEPMFLDDSDEEQDGEDVKPSSTKKQSLFMKKFSLKSLNWRWGKSKNKVPDFKMVDKESYNGTKADEDDENSTAEESTESTREPSNEYEAAFRHIRQNSIVNAINANSNNAPARPNGHSVGNSMSSYSSKSLSKSISTNSKSSSESTDCTPPESPQYSGYKCDDPVATATQERKCIYTGSASVCQWFNKRWRQLLSHETQIEVSISPEGGVISGFNSETGQLEMELYLSPNNEVRKSTLLDIQVTQTNHITMFRVKTPKDSEKFLEAVQIAKQEFGNQPLALTSRLKYSAPSCSSSHSSLGSIASLPAGYTASLAPPPPVPRLPTMYCNDSTSNVSTITEASTDEDPQLLLLNNLRCKWFNKESNGQWQREKDGKLVKMSVYHLANTTTKRVVVKSLDSSLVIFNQDIRPRCFQRVGKSGISLRIEDDEADTSEVVNLIQFKGDKEARYVNELLTSE